MLESRCCVRFHYLAGSGYHLEQLMRKVSLRKWVCRVTFISYLSSRHFKMFSSANIVCWLNEAVLWLIPILCQSLCLSFLHALANLVLVIYFHILTSHHFTFFSAFVPKSSVVKYSANGLCVEPRVVAMSLAWSNHLCLFSFFGTSPPGYGL